MAKRDECDKYLVFDKYGVYVSTKVVRNEDESSAPKKRRKEAPNSLPKQNTQSE